VGDGKIYFSTVDSGIELKFIPLSILVKQIANPDLNEKEIPNVLHNLPAKRVGGKHNEGVEGNDGQLLDQKE
jgi:hypothetical protein